MNGRMINETKIEKSIEKKLDKMPQYVKDWYYNLKVSRRTASTCNEYVKKVYNFLSSIDENVMNVSIDDITETQVSKFLLSTQTKEVNGTISYTSDSYQSMMWSCLNNFFNYLFKKGLINYNYTELIQKPKNHDIDRINENRVMLTSKDFKKILNSIDEETNPVMRKRNKALIMLFMNTGMRRSAMSNIMMDDIDFENNTLAVIDKGNKRHTYTLNDKMIESLKDWIDARQYYSKSYFEKHLFISRKGNGMDVNTIAEIVKKYTREALGKPLSPHKLRAGYCSILYEKTHDAEFVRRAVGHSNVATTQRYIVTKGNERKKAAEIMSSIL